MFKPKSILLASIIIGALTINACGQLDSNYDNKKVVDPCAASSQIVNPCAGEIKSYPFVKGEKEVTGSVSIQDGVVELSDDFSVGRGPDLKIALYIETNPPLTLSLDKVLILSETAFTKFEGAMSVQLPDDINITDYQSVVIFCEEYNVNFAYANIN